MKFKIPIIAFAALISLAAGYAPLLDKAKFDQSFDRIAAKNQAMISLAIVKDGELLYSRTIGYRQINGADGRSVAAANRFRIASLGKTYTAAMLKRGRG